MNSHTDLSTMLHLPERLRQFYVMKESPTSFILRGCFSFHSFANISISGREKQAELGLRTFVNDSVSPDECLSFSGSEIPHLSSKKVGSCDP